MTIAKGDRVTVYPHNQFRDRATGEVTAAWLGPHRTLIKITFPTVPPFARSATEMFLMNFGAGPWVEPGGGGHYEVTSEPK